MFVALARLSKAYVCEWETAKGKVSLYAIYLLTAAGAISPHGLVTRIEIEPQKSKRCFSRQDGKRYRRYRHGHTAPGKTADDFPQPEQRSGIMHRQHTFFSLFGDTAGAHCPAVKVIAAVTGKPFPENHAVFAVVVFFGGLEKGLFDAR